MHRFVLILAVVAMACDEGGGNNESHPAPEGVTTGFVASCDSTVNCCAQCFEYYGDNPSADFTGMFNESNCGDYKTQCSLEGAIGLCVISSDNAPQGIPEGITTVDVRYKQTANGEVYATAEQAEGYCVMQNGIWQPL